MTDELFELLKRKGLSDVDSLDDLIMNRYTVGEIVELDRELAELIEAKDGKAETQDVAGFDLWPNAELSGSRGGCSAATCRVDRVQRLARFAVIWADSVQVSPYFGVLHDNDPDEFRRTWLLGSLRAILGAEAAIRAGIIVLAPSVYTFCPTCGPIATSQMNDANTLLARAARSIELTYSDQVHVQFESRANDHILAIKGPEELLPHGEMAFLSGHPRSVAPTWLPASIRKRAEAGERVVYEVPKTRLRNSQALTNVIARVADDVLRQHMACRFRGTKYLTDRPADAAFLSAINDNDNFTAWNGILAQYLEYEMPILTGVPLTELIDLRKHDYEAFQVYRDTMKEIINNHIANRPAITGTEAKDLYDDMVRPRLHKMNQKLRAAKDKLSNKLRRDVVIAGGIVTLGLSSGLAFPPAAFSAAAAIPFAIDAARTALERSDASDELKSDNLYFLWKVAQKSRRN